MCMCVVWAYEQVKRRARADRVIAAAEDAVVPMDTLGDAYYRLAAWLSHAMHGDVGEGSGGAVQAAQQGHVSC